MSTTQATGQPVRIAGLAAEDSGRWSCCTA
jgi:hypothetical protein